MKKISRTCIAAIRNRRGKILMGADRKASYDWGHSELMERPKIRKDNGIIIGASGDGGLCTLIVDIMERHDIEEDITADMYMFYRFKPRLITTLKNHGYTDEHKLLRIPTDTYCGLLVAVLGQLYRVTIYNPETVSHNTFGEIEIDVASVPSAIGCGEMPATVSLIKDLRRDGYNTKEHLIEAIKLACELSPGCGIMEGTEPDIIGED